MEQESQPTTDSERTDPVTVVRRRRVSHRLLARCRPRKLPNRDETRGNVLLLDDSDDRAGESPPTSATAHPKRREVLRSALFSRGFHVLTASKAEAPDVVKLGFHVIWILDGTQVEVDALRGHGHAGAIIVAGRRDPKIPGTQHLFFPCRYPELEVALLREVPNSSLDIWPLNDLRGLGVSQAMLAHALTETEFRLALVLALAVGASRDFVRRATLQVEGIGGESDSLNKHMSNLCRKLGYLGIFVETKSKAGYRIAG